MRPEARLQRDIRAYLAKRGFRAIHVPNGAVLAGNGQQRARQMNALKRDGLCVGFPDLVVMGPSAMIGFIEVKIEGGKLSDSQRAVQQWMLEWGHLYAVCRSVADVEETLLEWGGGLSKRALASDDIEAQNKSGPHQRANAVCGPDINTYVRGA